MREVFAKFAAEEQFNQDELVGQLAVMKESLRRSTVGKTLAEQLVDAVAAEEYERVARLRDESPRQWHQPDRIRVSCSVCAMHTPVMGMLFRKFTTCPRKRGHGICFTNGSF